MSKRIIEKCSDSSTEDQLIKVIDCFTKIVKQFESKNNDRKFWVILRGDFAVL